MRKLALIGAIAALWLFFAAATTLADGGPHQITLNNGTSGLNADTCAGCHRAHTAKAASLLSLSQPDICLQCHSGAMASTDVLDGVQYSAAGPTTPILGALRGGGFQYALIDSSNAAKIVVSNSTYKYNAHVSPLAATQVGRVSVTSTHFGTSAIGSAGWGTGTVWGNGAVGASTTVGTGPTVTLECTSCHNPHGNGQYRILQTTPSLTPTAGKFVASIAKPGVQVTDTTSTGTHNYTIRPANDGYNQGGSASVDSMTGLGGLVVGTSGDYWRDHWDATGGTSWTVATAPIDQMNSGWNGTSATNASAYGTASTTLAANAGAADTTLAVVSSTGFAAVPFYVKVGSELILVKAVSGTTFTVTRAQGGTAAAAYNSGVTVATSAFNVQGTNGQALMNTTGLMTAWCIQCHTRYSGLQDANGNPSSLSNQNPTSDAIFMYKHGTTRIGCEQCHVGHGSNALMTGIKSSTYTDPNGVPSHDSRLLKVDNRGTCQLCHDPTGTITDGTYIGPDGTGGIYVGPLSLAPAGTVPGN